MIEYNNITLYISNENKEANRCDILFFVCFSHLRLCNGLAIENPNPNLHPKCKL